MNYLCLYVPFLHWFHLQKSRCMEWPGWLIQGLQSSRNLRLSNVSRDILTRVSSRVHVGWCDVLLPWESNPSRHPVGRQNGGCWMPFEDAYDGRQICNSRCPGPSREGLEVADAEGLAGHVGRAVVPSHSGDLHLPISTRGGGPPAGTCIIGMCRGGSASESAGLTRDWRGRAFRVRTV